MMAPLLQVPPAWPCAIAGGTCIQVFHFLRLLLLYIVICQAFIGLATVSGAHTNLLSVSACVLSIALR